MVKLAFGSLVDDSVPLVPTEVALYAPSLVQDPWYLIVLVSLSSIVSFFNTIKVDL
jgi:hypothetical protein